MQRRDDRRSFKRKRQAAADPVHGGAHYIGYRLRCRSDIWSTNRGAAEVRTADIRPTTEDDIRHNATTQDKDLLKIIMPFRFHFYFHYRMLRKKSKQPFEASALKQL